MHSAVTENDKIVPPRQKISLEPAIQEACTSIIDFETEPEFHDAVIHFQLSKVWFSLNNGDSIRAAVISGEDKYKVCSCNFEKAVSLY